MVFRFFKNSTQLTVLQWEESFKLSLIKISHIQAWEDLRKRVVEHNIRIMEKYYSRISMKRMSELLDLTPKVTIAFLGVNILAKYQGQCQTGQDKL